MQLHVGLQRIDLAGESPSVLYVQQSSKTQNFIVGVCLREIKTHDLEKQVQNIYGNDAIIAKKKKGKERTNLSYRHLGNG